MELIEAQSAFNENKRIVHTQQEQTQEHLWAAYRKGGTRILEKQLILPFSLMRKENFHLTRNILTQIKFCVNLDLATRKQMHSEDRGNLWTPADFIAKWKRSFKHCVGGTSLELCKYNGLKKINVEKLFSYKIPYTGKFQIEAHL